VKDRRKGPKPGVLGQGYGNLRARTALMQEPARQSSLVSKGVSSRRPIAL
jgi:hypothetical protein